MQMEKVSEEIDKENLENDDWNCNICYSSFFDEQKNEIANRCMGTMNKLYQHITC